MVQIIPPNPADMIWSQVGQAIGSGLGKAYDRGQEQEQRGKLASLLFGQEGAQQYGGLPADQQLQAAKLMQAQQMQQQQAMQQQESGMRDYETVKQAFGEDFANIWRSAPQGGKTELLKAGLDALMRGEDVNKLLSGASPTKIKEEEINLEEIPQMKDGKLPEDFDWPKFDKRPGGYTPKEWRQEMKDWRKENSPIFMENKKQMNNTKRDELGIKSLQGINKSKKLPEGFARLLIDPDTGDFYDIAKLAQIPSPEAQTWIKEISRFGNRAKDAFGSRVTNFDLQLYMKQFPNLLNTEEGRTRILKLMDVNNQLDSMYQNSLDQVYKKYGIGKIPMESADDMAQSLIKDQVDKLRDEYVKTAQGIQVVSGLSNQGYKEGDIATDTDTGQKFIFTNGRWIKQ